MGARGPKPTPTPILNMRGSWRGKAREKEGEPKPVAGRPKCPSWLDDDAKACWKSIVPLLESMGVLDKIGGKALTRYCRFWSRWKKAEEFIQKHGECYPIKDEHGKLRYMQQFPQVSISNQLAQRLAGLEADFGMTPAARSRIRIEKKNDKPKTAAARHFG